MFKSPFSFNGRIRRLEYGLSILIYLVVYVIIAALTGMFDENPSPPSFLLLLLIIPVIWFVLAQGAKRCHDLGNSGWFQLIPFYSLFMLFGNGESRTNKYGQNPKNPEEVDFDFINTPQSPALPGKD